MSNAEASGHQNTKAYFQVTQCEDGSFCCEGANQTCCDSGTGIYLNRNGTVVLPNPKQTTTATGSNQTAGSTSINEGTSSTCSTKELRISLGVSVGVLSLALLALGMFAIQQRRTLRVNRPKQQTDGVHHNGPFEIGTRQPQEKGTTGPVEMEGRQRVAEMQ